MKIEWKHGWKVVRKTSLDWCSATTLGNTHQYSTKYVTNHKRNCGPLAVFNSREAARKFNVDNRQLEYLTVFKCVYTKSKMPQLWFTSYAICRHRVTCEDGLPNGTRLANSIRLVEKARCGVEAGAK